MAFVSYFIFRNIGANLIKQNIKDLQKKDCLCFDFQKHSKLDYFIRAAINDEKIKKNEKIIMLEYLGIKKSLFNHYEENLESKNLFF